MPSSELESDGGYGGGSSGNDKYGRPPHDTMTRLERRALAHGWALTAEQRKALLERQIRVALDPNTDERDARLSTKIALEADVINLGLRRLDLQEEIAARKEQGATQRIGLSAIVKALAEEAKAKVVEATPYESAGVSPPDTPADAPESAAPKSDETPPPS